MAFSDLRRRIDDYRQRMGTEPFWRLVERTVRTALEAGFVDDITEAPVASLPEIAALFARRGINAGTVYRLYAKTHPDRLALVDPSRQLTYGEAEEEISRLVSLLRNRLAVGRKTPVVLLMQNRVEYLLIWMALIRLEATVIHASWRQTASELAYQLAHSGAKIIFAGESVRSVVQSVMDDDELQNLEVIGVGSELGGLSYYTLLDSRTDGEYESTDRRSGDASRADGPTPGSDNIVYTSGTTGRPKGAVRDLSSFGLTEFFRILERLPVAVGDRHLVVTPLYHSGAQAFSLMQAAMGATLFIEASFDPQRTVRILSREAIHSLFLVPAMIKRILELPSSVFADNPTDSLRVLISGAAPFPQSLRERAIERFGPSVVHDFYGATEIGWITLINGAEMLERPHSVGRPLAGQRVCIMDRDGNCLPRNETGLIYVRNGQLMQGYLSDEQATSASMRDGWMTVDDVGFVDEDDYLYVVGRARDMIISGGVNIYPAEVERVIADHRAVDEVAVIGIDDESWGELVVAVVVTHDDATDHRLAEELAEYSRSRLSGYKVPRQWHFVESLPRNPTGKVLKRKLRQTIAAENPHGAGNRN